MEESVRYSLNQKEQLTAFLEVTKVPIRNNLASRPGTVNSFAQISSDILAEF